ncbi:MAG: hypothetical protein QGI60_01680 [archaeon]|jgi:hypothetical protein|nr:hypothetical protein [archaeon]
MSFELKLAALAVFLIVHGVAHFKGWYYTPERVDMLTHFLGGLALGGFLKDYEIAVPIIFGWEFFEMLLVRESRAAFKENPFNKISDLFFGILGFAFGFEFL